MPSRAGSTAGLPAAGHSGKAAPPTAATEGSAYGASRRSSQYGRAAASSSRKAITWPAAFSTPVFRAPDRPRAWALRMTLTPGSSAAARSASASLWSITSSSSPARQVCAATEATARTMSSQRRSVYAHTTTDTDRRPAVTPPPRLRSHQ